MTFKKTREIIERVDNSGGILLIKTLEPSIVMQSVSDEQLIAAVISSKYHYWQGEHKPDGINVVMSSTDKYEKSPSSTLENHKFYGFFDNSKIKTDHYKEVTFDNFYNRLMSAIKEETENDNKFIRLSETVITNNLKCTATYYFLDLDQEKNKDLVAEWQVYTFFYAFISIDKENNCIHLIEFGLD